MTWVEIIIWFTICLIGLGGLAVWMIILIVYKHKVRIIDLGKQSIELDFRARDYRNEGVWYWQLDRERNKEMKNMPVPPAEVINIAKRGKKSITAWRTPTGEYIWMPRPDLDILKKKKLEDDTYVLDDKAIQPFTTKQRMIQRNNYQKAISRKGFSLREQIPTMVSIGALTIIVIALMIFWGDIAQPTLEARQIGVQEQTVQKETLQIIKEIRHDQQQILGQGEGGGTAPN